MYVLLYYQLKSFHWVQMEWLSKCMYHNTSYWNNPIETKWDDQLYVRNIILATEIIPLSPNGMIIYMYVIFLHETRNGTKSLYKSKYLILICNLFFQTLLGTKLNLNGNSNLVRTYLDFILNIFVIYCPPTILGTKIIPLSPDGMIIYMYVPLYL